MLSSVIFFVIISLIFFVYFQSKSDFTNKDTINTQTADVTKPKFSINSDTQKILVTANEGHFLTEDDIMLKKNVIFKSNKFKIYSNNVVFNKKKLIASSNEESKFVSNKASIDSIGFDIIKNGNIINFKGKTKLILK